MDVRENATSKKRLIDADELRDTIENEHFGEYEDKETTFYCIDIAPTVNAVIVTHGHWETNSDRPDSLICSVCKCGFDMWKHDPTIFVPIVARKWMETPRDVRSEVIA